jgi:putative FmdB family regulatory protein
MPIYEYRCRSCGRRVQILTLRVSEAPDETCPRCGGSELDRLPSRFALPRSAESRLDALADAAGSAGIDESDPRSVARWMRRMGSELGEEVGAEGLDEIVDEIESAADEPADAESS